MAVKLTSGGKLLFPLTSPPPKPIPAPDEALIAKVVTYQDREIMVTVPFPDTVELVAEVVNDLWVVPDKSGKPNKAIYQEIDQDIQNSLVEIAMSVPDFVIANVNPKKPTWAKFSIAYDEARPFNKAHVSLRRKETTDFGKWLLRFEFNAAKVGPAGFVRLTEGLAAALPFLCIPKLINSFKIARIDAAVDCIGATPLDLIAHIPKPGKRMVFVGDHGRPESVYFYQKKPPPKSPPKKLGTRRTTGPHRLTLYERRDYHLQLLLQPPYGPSPVTRAEVPKRWTKKRPFLTEVAGLTNLFIGRSVAYAAAVDAGEPKAWRQFCLAAFGGGINKSLFSWFPGPGQKFAHAYAECVGDLIDPSCWNRWEDGLTATGLMDWIKSSQADA